MSEMFHSLIPIISQITYKNDFNRNSFFSAFGRRGSRWYLWRRNCPVLRFGNGLPMRQDLTERIWRLHWRQLFLDLIIDSTHILIYSYTLMSFDQEASPQERYGCNCNKLWLRKAPLESWALSCVKYNLYSWLAFRSTMRKSIIKAPAYICNSNPMNYDGILVPSWQNLGWAWTLS